MTKREAAQVKVGEQLFNTHYKQLETVISIHERGNDTDQRVAYPLFITDKDQTMAGCGTTYRLFKRTRLSDCPSEISAQG